MDATGPGAEKNPTGDSLLRRGICTMSTKERAARLKLSGGGKEVESTGKKRGIW